MLLSDFIKFWVDTGAKLEWIDGPLMAHSVYMRRLPKQTSCMPFFVMLRVPLTFGLEAGCPIVFPLASLALVDTPTTTFW